MKRFLSKIRLTPKQWLIFGVLLIAIVWTGRGLYIMYIRYEQSKSDYEHSQKEVQSLENREAELQKKIEHLETQRGIEGELRTRFNASKNGEELVVIVDKNGSGSATSTDQATSFWQKIKDWFKR